MGSSHHQPNSAFARILTSVAAAMTAHSHDCAASPAVAPEPSCVATRPLARASRGMTTIAPADTAAPAELTSGCELPARVEIASKARYSARPAKHRATSCCARRSAAAEPSRRPVYSHRIVLADANSMSESRPKPSSATDRQREQRRSRLQPPLSSSQCSAAKASSRGGPTARGRRPQSECQGRRPASSRLTTYPRCRQPRSEGGNGAGSPAPPRAGPRDTSDTGRVAPMAARDALCYNTHLATN